MKKNTRNTLSLILWFSLLAIACNLTSTESPPTIVPRTSIAATPGPTLGFATQPPGAGGNVVATTIAQQTQVDVEIYNLLNEVQQDRLYTHVDALVNFHTRHANSTQTSLDRGVGAAFNYINNQMKAIQQRHPEHFTVFPDGHEFTMAYNGLESTQRNVVAILQGTEAGAGTIIVGAHYDSRTDNQNDASGYAPGAVDNGSGVAAVLELARVLADKPQRATIMFVLFAAEEVGRVGSREFVQNYLQRYNFSTEDTYMINLDTIGSWNDSEGNINDAEIRVFSPGPNNSPSRQLARTIDFIGFNFGLDLDPILIDGLDRDGRWGDQQSFSDEGYPAVRFIEALEDHYNREGRDTIDKLEPAYLAKSTRTVLGVIMSLSGGPRPPTNMALRPGNNPEEQYLIWEPVPDAASYIVGVRRAGDLNVSAQFNVVEPRTADWGRWREFEAVSIAAVDANGMIGPLSDEYLISGL